MRILDFTDGFESNQQPTPVTGGSASDIANVPQGNLTSDNVQDALNELQTEIDNISVGGAPDATTTTKGLVKLAGDLSGTADAPTVPGLANKADITDLDEKVDKTTTINGQSLDNDVEIDKSDIGLGNVDNTSDANKPVSTATQDALDEKADISVVELALEDKVDKTTTINGHDLSADVTISKSDVGLGNADNTSDANKPVSTATQAALDSKADVSSLSSKVDKTTKVNGHELTGDVTISKSDVGLGNADNTSDANKPVSTATQTALNAKEPTVASGTTSQYYRGDKSWQTLNKSAVGLGNVDNTSDANKPVSTATANEILLVYEAIDEATVNYDNMTKELSNKDTGKYKTITWKDSSNVRRKESVLSGGTAPYFTTRTVTFYAVDGTTVVGTPLVYTISYDGDNEFLKEVLN